MESALKMSFEDWYRRVDTEVGKLTGLGRDDLPDCCYADWFDEGITPVQAAKRAIKAVKD
jgi:hypothetical protein